MREIARAVHPDPTDRLDWPRHGLSPRALQVVRAATAAMLCDEDDQGRLQPARADICENAVGEFDHAVGRGSADLRRGYALLTFLLEWLPLFLIGAPSRMSRLPLDRRVAYLEALEASSVGLLVMLYVAFKVPLCIPAFEHEDELSQTGFDRPHTAARRRLATVAATASSDGPGDEAST